MLHLVHLELVKRASGGGVYESNVQSNFGLATATLPKMGKPPH